jgi:2-C-methyl-D-erythritol 4-phosphate cytidylyltransferase
MTGAVVVGCRPVTDTVKVLAGGELGATVDRTRLRSVTSPVVIPTDVLATLDRLDATDFPTLVADLAEHAPIEWLEAPALSARVRDEDDLVLLEALSRAEASA